MLELTLCNELLAKEGLSLSDQARLARELGYAGLEIAPHTLSDEPHGIGRRPAAEMRAAVEAEGVRVTGLHWLLSGYADASITDPARAGEAQAICLGLVDLCAALGGRYLVHGSPGQRVRPEGIAEAELSRRLAGFFGPLAARAGELGLTYVIEPLARAETEVINTVAEGAALVAAVDHPAFATMIDISAAGQTEPPVADLVRDWVPRGVIGHIHANDTNRGAPGMGRDPFPEIVGALLQAGWKGPVGVEPFRTLVDARVTAAVGAAPLRACEMAARGGR